VTVRPYDHKFFFFDFDLIWSVGSGIKGSMYKVMRSSICRGCSNPVISTGHTNVDIGASANLELVDKFCYLDDII